MRKKSEGIAVIERVDYPNKGRFTIQKEDGSIIKGMIKNTIPGQTVHYRESRKYHGKVEGTLLSIEKDSPLETREAVCDIFGECGGCIYQKIPYADQLKMKEDQCRRLLEPLLEENTVYDGIKGSPEEFGFRNKMDFSFGNEEKGGDLRLGLHRRQTRYTVLNADSCKNVHPDMTAILTCVRTYCLEKKLPIYNKVIHEGYLRFLLIRRSRATGEILVLLAHSTQMQHDFSELAGRLKKLEGEKQLKGHLTGFWDADDDSVADALKPERVRCIFGRDSMTERLLGLEFKVTLFSFFQTNSKGAEQLYETVRDYIQISDAVKRGGSESKPVLYDLYCGTGTIAQIVSPAASKVYGIELIPEAVRAARENARRNGITNCEFLSGDVLEMLPSIKEKPDYLILDPPREGIRPKTLKKLLQYDVQNMIYVSCKASSFVQDMAVMREAGWQCERYTLVDMFPHSVHVELVCSLKRTG